MEDTLVNIELKTGNGEKFLSIEHFNPYMLYNLLIILSVLEHNRISKSQENENIHRLCYKNKKPVGSDKLSAFT